MRDGINALCLRTAKKTWIERQLCCRPAKIRRRIAGAIEGELTDLYVVGGWGSVRIVAAGAEDSAGLGVGGGQGGQDAGRPSDAIFNNRHPDVCALEFEAHMLVPPQDC